MSQLDVRNAKLALAARLRFWGLEAEAESRAAGFIDDLVTKGWQMAPHREERPQPPKVQRACPTCGHDVDSVRPDCAHPSSRPTPRDPAASVAGASLARALLHAGAHDKEEGK